MDRNAAGGASGEGGRAEVVILSGACCNPSAGALDERAREVVAQAASAAGVDVSVRMKPISAALYGGIPSDVVAQLKRDSAAGGLRMPVVIVDGRGVSYGVPNVEQITAALHELAAKSVAE